MNNIRQKNVAAGLMQSRDIPYQDASNVSQFSECENMTYADVNNAMRQLLDNDLFVENSLNNASAYVAGPKTDAALDSAPDGYKVFGDLQSSGTMETYKKVETPLSATVTKISSGRATFVAEWGGFVFAGFASSGVRYETDARAADFAGTIPIQANGYYADDERMLFAASDGVYQLSVYVESDEAALDYGKKKCAAVRLNSGPMAAAVAVHLDVKAGKVTAVTGSAVCQGAYNASWPLERLRESVEFDGQPVYGADGRIDSDAGLSAVGKGGDRLVVGGAKGAYTQSQDVSFSDYQVFQCGGVSDVRIFRGFAYVGGALGLSCVGDDGMEKVSGVGGGVVSLAELGGNLYAATAAGLYGIGPDGACTGDLLARALPGNNPFSASHPAAFVAAGGGILLMGSDRGLYSIDPAATPYVYEIMDNGESFGVGDDDEDVTGGPLAGASSAAFVDGALYVGFPNGLYAVRPRESRLAETKIVSGLSRLGVQSFGSAAASSGRYLASAGAVADPQQPLQPWYPPEGKSALDVADMGSAGSRLAFVACGDAAYVARFDGQTRTEAQAALKDGAALQADAVAASSSALFARRGSNLYVAPRSAEGAQKFERVLQSAPQKPLEQFGGDVFTFSGNTVRKYVAAPVPKPTPESLAGFKGYSWSAALSGYVAVRPGGAGILSGAVATAADGDPTAQAVWCPFELDSSAGAVNCAFADDRTSTLYVGCETGLYAVQYAPGQASFSIGPGDLVLPDKGPVKSVCAAGTQTAGYYRYEFTGLRPTELPSDLWDDLPDEYSEGMQVDARDVLSGVVPYEALSAETGGAVTWTLAAPYDQVTETVTVNGTVYVAAGTGLYEVTCAGGSYSATLISDKKFTRTDSTENLFAGIDEGGRLWLCETLFADSGEDDTVTPTYDGTNPYLNTYVDSLPLSCTKSAAAGYASSAGTPTDFGHALQQHSSFSSGCTAVRLDGSFGNYVDVYVAAGPEVKQFRYYVGQAAAAGRFGDVADFYSAPAGRDEWKWADFWQPDVDRLLPFGDDLAVTHYQIGISNWISSEIVDDLGTVSVVWDNGVWARRVNVVEPADRFDPMYEGLDVGDIAYSGPAFFSSSGSYIQDDENVSFSQATAGALAGGDVAGLCPVDDALLLAWNGSTVSSVAGTPIAWSGAAPAALRYAGGYFYAKPRGSAAWKYCTYAAFMKNPSLAAMTDFGGLLDEAGDSGTAADVRAVEVDGVVYVAAQSGAYRQLNLQLDAPRFTPFTWPVFGGGAVRQITPSQAGVQFTYAAAPGKVSVARYQPVAGQTRQVRYRGADPDSGFPVTLSEFDRAVFASGQIGYAALGGTLYALRGETFVEAPPTTLDLARLAAAAQSGGVAYVGAGGDLATFTGIAETDVWHSLGDAGPASVSQAVGIDGGRCLMAASDGLWYFEDGECVLVFGGAGGVDAAATYRDGGEERYLASFSKQSGKCRMAWSKNYRTWRDLLDWAASRSGVSKVYSVRLGDRTYFAATDAGLFYTKYSYSMVADNREYTRADALADYNRLFQSAISAQVSAAISSHSDLSTGAHARGTVIGRANSDYVNAQLDNIGDWHSLKLCSDAPTGPRYVEATNDVIDEMAFGDYGDGDVGAAVSSYLFDEPVEQKNLTYITKRWTSGVTEVYVNVPSTSTYYLANCQGASNCRRAPDDEYARKNLADFPEEKQTQDSTLSTHYTSLSVTLASASYRIDDVLDVQIAGNSPPLGIYKDQTGTGDFGPAGAMYRSFAEPSLVTGYDLTKTDEDGNYVFRFACFGTDAQAVKIMFYDRNARSGTEYVKVVFDPNGGEGKMAAEKFLIFRNSRGETVLEQKALRRCQFTNESSGRPKFFAGWSTIPLADNAQPAYEDKAPFPAYRSCEPSDPSFSDLMAELGDPSRTEPLEKKEEFRLYAVWLDYQFSSADTTLMMASDRSQFYIDKVGVDPSTRLKNTVLVNFGD